MSLRDLIDEALTQLDIAERARSRQRPGSADRDIADAHSRIRRALEDARELTPSPHDPKCTGVAASWCPVHGDCTCPHDEEGGPVFKNGDHVEDDACPLHGVASTHAERRP